MQVAGTDQDRRPAILYLWGSKEIAMKYITNIIIAVSLLVPLSAAETLPPDVSRVIAMRDTEIKRINQRCVIELERLKVSYTKRGDLKNAVLVDNLIKGMKARQEIVGSWLFDFRGKPRAYTFHENGSMSGAYASSGSRFNGTWKADGDNVEISNERGEIIANVAMSAEGGPSMKTTSYNVVMSGKKID